MRAIFEKMDKNFDGKLTREEIVAGFIDMEIDNPEQEAENIFQQADMDGNGFIEFTEWCTATMDKRKMLSKDRLKAAFDIFDRDGSGSISFTEVKALLDHGGGTNNQVFEEMIAEMDLDGDGEISFPEFEKMMTVLI
mmetsp:Transcript_29657/g.45208  ORF Transcript_29657/g.45208 Transcript_29657/m.45208 type:complete len:137 (+) Transcript_29657:1277-1687(+)